MKTIKNLETKAIQNVQSVKGGNDFLEKTTLGDISALAALK